MITQEKNNKDDDFVIDIVGVYNIFWASRKFIISFVSIAAVISVMIALSLPIVYKSSAKIFPNDASVNQSSIASQFGGIASLAGIQLGQTSPVEVTLNDCPISPGTEFAIVSKSGSPIAFNEDER